MYSVKKIAAFLPGEPIASSLRPRIENKKKNVELSLKTAETLGNIRSRSGKWKEGEMTQYIFLFSFLCVNYYAPIFH